MSVRYFDTLVLTLVTFIPAIGGALLVIVPRRDRDIRIFALIISLLTFGLSLHLIARVHRLLPGFQYEIDKAWVSSPNIHYHMGVDGISVSPGYAYERAPDQQRRRFGVGAQVRRQLLQAGAAADQLR